MALRVWTSCRSRVKWPLRRSALAPIQGGVPQRVNFVTTCSSSKSLESGFLRWVEQGVGGVAIHAALWREHGYRGSYSSVRRMLAEIHASIAPTATVRLYFAPAE